MSDNISLILIGHSQETAVREIIQIALGAKISLTEQIPEKDFCISKATERGNIITVNTTIDFNGKAGENEYKHTVNPEKNERQNMTDAVKIGFYRLFCELYGKTLPWGSQTGIRPALLASKRLAVLNREQTVAALREEYGISEEKAMLATEVSERESALLKEKPPRGISLYIGIPFCPTRCRYCSFVSIPLTKQKKNVAPYVSCLAREIEYVGELVRRENVKVDSIYIGGGTPTSVDEQSLEKLLEAVYNSFDINSLYEYTVEAGRADTVNEEKFRIIRRLTPDTVRISINPQTMNDSVLCAIGRAHTREDFEKAFYMARETGFGNVNCDVIAGLPTESTEMFLASLTDLCKLSPENITMHTMCVKRAAALTRSDTSESGDAVKMVSEGGKILRAHGYAPYYMYRQKDTLGGLENTGYAKPHKEGLYNVLMMEDISTVIGLGAGGVSKLIDTASGRIDRVYNFKDPWEYIAHFDEVLKRKRLK